MCIYRSSLSSTHSSKLFILLPSFFFNSKRLDHFPLILPFLSSLCLSKLNIQSNWLGLWFSECFKVGLQHTNTDKKDVRKIKYSERQLTSILFSKNNTRASVTLQLCPHCLISHVIFPPLLYHFCLFLSMVWSWSQEVQFSMPQTMWTFWWLPEPVSQLYNCSNIKHIRKSYSVKQYYFSA